MASTEIKINVIAVGVDALIAFLQEHKDAICEIVEAATIPREPPLTDEGEIKAVCDQRTKDANARVNAEVT